MREACFADVNSGDAGIGFAKGNPGGLGSATASDKNFHIGARLARGPNEMEESAATLGILVERAMFVEAGEWWRIREAFVEITQIRQVLRVRPHAGIRLVQSDLDLVADFCTSC